MKRWMRIAGAALLAVALLAPAAEACPTCKNGLGSDMQGQRVARGYFYSILFMMGMPFVLVGSFGAYAYFGYRRVQAERASAPEETQLDEGAPRDPA